MGDYEDIIEGNINDEYAKMTYANGNIYEGQWVNDQRDGNGKMTYANGNIYEGQWKNNQRDGNGKMIWKNGEWKNDRYGDDKHIFKKGDIYEGQWNNDQRNGNGKMTYANGNIFECNYKDDVEHGYGKITYTNGDFLYGNLENGKMEGKFVRKQKNIVYILEYKNDVEISQFIIKDRSDLRSYINKYNIIKPLSKLPNIKINDSDISNKCKDIFTMSSYKIDKLLDINNDKLIFIFYDPRKGLNMGNIKCLSRTYLKKCYDDEENHFYKCQGRVLDDGSMGIGDSDLYNNLESYVKIALDFHLYIPQKQLNEILFLSHYISFFYIIPKLDENNNQIGFSHTIAKTNLGRDANYVSSYHCQKGSDIKLHYVAICDDPETCVKTFMNDILDYKVIIDNPDIDETEAEIEEEEE